jgi:hypothetical protein
MLGAFEQGYVYRATPAVTRDLGFSGLIQKTAPFSRLSLPGNPFDLAPPLLAGGEQEIRNIIHLTMATTK